SGRSARTTRCSTYRTRTRRSGRATRHRRRSTSTPTFSPAGLKAPAVQLSVHKDSAMGELASGRVRIRPTSESLLADTRAEQPAGVGNQIWENDEDLQAKSIDKDFTNGEINLAEGELVYGVHYLVSIYDVDGYQPFEGNITAGVDSSRTLVLTPTT